MAIAIAPKASATQVENSAEPRFPFVTGRPPIAAAPASRNSSKPFSPVHGQDLPGDVTRPVAAQKQHRLGDVVDVGKRDAFRRAIVAIRHYCRTGDMRSPMRAGSSSDVADPKPHRQMIAFPSPILAPDVAQRLLADWDRTHDKLRALIAVLEEREWTRAEDLRRTRLVRPIAVLLSAHHGRHRTDALTPAERAWVEAQSIPLD